MKNLILFLILITITSCGKENQTIKGDLYFKLINIVSPEGMSEEQVITVEKTLDNVPLHLHNKYKKIYDHFEKLRKHKLLRLPFIKLRVNENDIKNIYLSKKEYEKIKRYTYSYLSKNKTKLEVELQFQELEKDIYYSDNIINFKEIKGETYYKK